MADKIKGWVDQFSVPPHQQEQNENITVQDHKWLSGDLQCTLVVTDERVFTESEVRAMMRSITHCTGSPLASIHINEVRRVFAEDYGITLDPA
jgi:hypothetical protein